MLIRRSFITAFLFLSLTGSVFPQGKVNGPLKVCLGDISSFSYTAPVGLNVSSINWDFGDGNSSSVITPAHTYSLAGKYTVRLQITYTNSSTGTDSLKLEVFDLPKPFFYKKAGSDTCLNRNKVVFYDTSSPAKTGQTITRRVFVWGDGDTLMKNFPKKGDSLIHNYFVADKYTIRLELTDNQGCRNTASKELNIIQTVTTNFEIVKKFANCTTGELCVKNKSVDYGTGNPRFRWYIDTSALDTGAYYSPLKCVPYTKSRKGKVTLISFVNPVCLDTFTLDFDLNVDPLPNKIDLLDTVVCHSFEGLNLASIPDIGRDYVKWYVDNMWNSLNYSHENYFGTQKFPGTYIVKAEIIRGTCTTTLTRPFKVNGPFARVLASDRLQCFSNRDVFMWDNSAGINRDQCKFYWKMNDPNADNCIQQRTKDINKFKNCEVSLDWFDKHRFQKGNGLPYKVFYMITDTVSGCIDSTELIVDMNFCAPLLKKDTIRVCQGSYFADGFLPPYPKFFSVDKGATWLPFPWLMDSSYSGDYSLSYIFESHVSPWAEHFGDDSIALHNDTATYYDTFFSKQVLRISAPRKDSVWYQIRNNCKPYRVTVYFSNTLFRKGESLSVYWSDTGNIDTVFQSDTYIDSLVHYYNASGVNAMITVKTETTEKCQNIFRFPVNRGKFLKYSSPFFFKCIYNKVCIYPYVQDARTLQYWTKNTPGNYVKWWFPDTTAEVTRYNPCVRYTSGGLRPFKMIAVDSFGCSDTLQDSVFIQDIQANIRKSSDVVYCSELKQFFDSSTLYKNPPWRSFLPVYFEDSIKFYSWQFGSGTFSSLKKNPLQSFTSSLDSIPAAHVVTTPFGCTDTFRFYIKLIGPKPYFNIRDTIGCGSLTATFINLSRFSKQYIWNFGDSANSQLQRFDKQNIQFTYNKPGRYHISLTGIDTVYNPFTNKYQACVSTFPDKLFQKDTTRSVLVLPFRKTGISGPDTICSGTPVVFSSSSDTAYNGDLWHMGDSSLYDTGAPSSVLHRFVKDGTYKIKLNPYYTDSVAMLCRDSAEKTIVVMGVKADFDIDPLSVAPVFKLYNRSVPASAALNWDFGKVGSGNTSSEQNPQVNYGTDTGTYTICLVASIPYGCSDTICKTVFNDYLTDFGIFNVFTPGSIDNLNDKYDIQIEGESLYDLRIYNRWGVLVYESDKDADNTSDGNWNGKVFNTGAECPSGTYYYIFRYSLKNKPEEVETIQGVIQLIR